jgi:cobalt/nickel transport system ATP-binding protein
MISRSVLNTPPASDSSAQGDELVRLEAVRFTYPDGTRVCYEGLPFVVHRGERVVLLGPNGSGKTTLLYHILGLLRPDDGLVRVFGVDPARAFEQIRWRIGVVLQNPDEQIIAPTVADDIAFGPRNYGLPEDEVRQRVRSLAQQFGITHLLDKVPHYLSGGERTKVALAGALAMYPDLLVLDEPFEGLDTLAKSELARLLSHLHRRHGTTIIVSTHEINLIPEFIDTIYLLARGGRIVMRGSPHELLARPELLAEHHLEPPVLALLFDALRRRGIPVSPALTVEEAVEQLMRFASGTAVPGR